MDRVRHLLVQSVEEISRISKTKSHELDKNTSEFYLTFDSNPLYSPIDIFRY